MKQDRVSRSGIVAPNGVGKEAFWQALTNGLSGVRTIRRFDILGSSPIHSFLGKRNEGPESALRPFDLGADVPVLGEGAALFINVSISEAAL
jgi:hypothetical protein